MYKKQWCWKNKKWKEWNIKHRWLEVKKKLINKLINKIEKDKKVNGILQQCGSRSLDTYPLFSFSHLLNSLGKNLHVTFYEHTALICSHVQFII